MGNMFPDGLLIATLQRRNQPVFNLKIYNMDTKQQIDLMEKVNRELEDLKNSQTAVLKKITQIEADNINLGSSELEEMLPEIHEEIDDAVEKISALQEKFSAKKDEFVRDNPVSEE